MRNPTASKRNIVRAFHRLQIQCANAEAALTAAAIANGGTLDIDAGHLGMIGDETELGILRMPNGSVRVHVRNALRPVKAEPECTVRYID